MKRCIQASDDFKVIIDTGLTDPKALDVLNGVCGQLSDGIWENSPRMIPFWNCIDVDGGKLIFNTGSYYDYRYNGYNSSPFRAMSEQQMKTWFANKIKQVVKQFESDYGSEGKWDRNNTAVCDYLNYNSGATVQDAYRVYDVLLGRKPRIQEVETSKKVDSKVKYVKSSSEKDKLVIFKKSGKYCVTPESNYNARVQDAKKITKCDDFDSPQEIIDYYVQYSSAKPDDFIVLDKVTTSTNINNEDQIIEKVVQSWCDYWDKSDSDKPTNMPEVIHDVAYDIKDNRSLPKDTRRYFLNFINNYLSSDIKDNPDYNDTYNKIVDTLYKHNIEKYITKSGRYGDKYVVTYYEEYPIYEPAEGGYYYAGNEVAYQAEFDTLEEAIKDFKEVVKEYSLTEGSNYKAFKDSKYIGEGASAYIESDSDINFPAVNSEISGWHPYS